MSPLLSGLVDDAGLFPPSSLPMADALARHRSSRHPMLSGRFLCPSNRVGELLAELGADEVLEVHLVGAVADLPADPRLTVRAVEGTALATAPLPSYVEGVAPADLAGTGAFGKVRCGGVRIPPAEELGDYVRQCVAHDVMFKATAGMHAAIRGWESTDGHPHHGYLNLLLAVSRALSGGDVEGALLTTDAESLAAEATSMDLELAGRTRGIFHSYGSCDTERPVRDAETLGLL